MPEIVTHYYFAQNVLEQLPEGTREQINPELWNIGVRGPDPLGIVYYRNLPRWRTEHRKSNQMHTKGCGKLFRSIAEKAKRNEDAQGELLFSYLAGFLTHYALDSICHPYIIYRTGSGKENAGNHRSIEHAIDRKRLDEHGLNGKERPITGSILPQSDLPAGIRSALNDAYAEAFGWHDAWDLMNQALKDERRFVHLAEDPTGSFYRMLSRLTKNTNLLSLSYAELAYQDADIENEGREECKNPYDPSIRSSLSMRQLEEQALELAIEMIQGTEAFIFSDGSYPESIGNRSFESGLDAEAPQNQATLTCAVLKRR